ncbi:hypothetical protein N6H14_27440 [Paenibacillus sp. CC-CFT747]|nr:hypothetical protein N6H14_27440 [Paenibacillus sp. CC-CFT747]
MNPSTAKENQPRVIPFGAKSRYGLERDDAHLAFWLQSSLKRVYPLSKAEGGIPLSS